MNQGTKSKNKEPCHSQDEAKKESTWADWKHFQKAWKLSNAHANIFEVVSCSKKDL